MSSALLLLLFLPILPAAAQKRRSVIPGKGACVYGVLDPFVYVSAIALDGSFVYYVDSFDTEVYRVPKNGGARTKLGEFPNVNVSAMAVDDANVYLATYPDDFESTIPPGDIYAIPKAGGSHRTIASGVLYATELAADATHVYWASVGTIKLFEQVILSDGKIERASKDGASRQVLASGLSAPVSVALDGANVYFGETGLASGNPSIGLRSIAKSGGSGVSVMHYLDSHLVAYLAISGNDVVFSGGNGTTGGLFRVARTGGAVQQLVEDENIDSAPRIAGGQVYYLTFPDGDVDDALMRVPITGGTAQFLRSPNSIASDFEVDDCGLYIGTTDEELVKGTR